jgi:hypothetical protein
VVINVNVLRSLMVNRVVSESTLVHRSATVLVSAYLVHTLVDTLVYTKLTLVHA